MSKPKVFLLDAHGICYRAFYAVKSLANSKGQATNAVFGFTNILKKLMRDFRPEYMAACFDVGKKTLRQEQFADYKIQRQSMPEDLRSQIPLIREVLKAYQIPIFEKEGYEADDVMATLARQATSQKAEVVIVSDDKDLCQLMSKGIEVYSARQEKMLTDDDINDKFGVKPSQIVDYLALAGDSSDNIPGVDGIGAVSAVKLISAYGSLDNIYTHLDEIKPLKLQEKLTQGKQSALMSYTLATVDDKVPLEASLEDLKLKESNGDQLYKLFSELEFKKFAQEVKEEQGITPKEDTQELFSNPIDKLQITVHGEKINIVYDLKSLCQKGKDHFKGKVFDVLLAQYLLNGGLSRAQLPRAKSEKEFIKEYEDCIKQLKEQQMDFLYDHVELPLINVLLRMEQVGVQLDLEVLKKLSIIGEKKLKELQEELYKIAGEEFNVNSPKQLSEILFERLKLPVVKKTKTGFSTDEEVLTKLADKHPLPALILEYRQMAKLKSTYLDALPTLVDQQDRVHAHFNQMGAETGRLSSNNPNLQNIPVRTDLGRQIRKAFIPFRQEDLLLSADYSQIELRLLAHYCKDPELLKAFKSDGDIHRYTASLMFDVNEDKVDDRMRYAAKRINFGIIYGMSAFGLAKDLDVSMAQAQDFIDRYFLRYPKVKVYMDEAIEFAQEHGYVETLYHRRRYLPDIKSANIGLRQFAQRQAINAPLQGTAADLIKLAMVNIDRELSKQQLSSVMIMTVHDELVFNMIPSEKDQLLKLVKEQMQKVASLEVLLKADLKIGQNWMEMTAVKI